jgi:hypothetical protein
MPAPPEVEVVPGDDVAVGDDVPVALGDDVPLVLELPAPLATVAAPPPLALAAGALASARTAKLGSIRWATRKSLFRGPAGLADGLALKEPAPPAVSPRDSPQGTGSPAPRMSWPADSASREYTH